MEKIIIIEFVEKKKGVNKYGKNWTMYAFKLADGRTGSTFEGKYAQYLGKEVMVILEKDQYGWKIIEQKKQAQTTQSSQVLDDIKARLDSIEVKLDSIQHALNKKVERDFEGY